MIPYLIQSEMEYRRDRTRREIVARRGSRSRSSWLRRLAAAERSV